LTYGIYILFIRAKQVHYGNKIPLQVGFQG